MPANNRQGGPRRHTLNGDVNASIYDQSYNVDEDRFKDVNIDDSDSLSIKMPTLSLNPLKFAKISLN